MGRSESEAILTSFLEHKCPKPAEAAQKPQSTKITFDFLCSLHHSKDLFGAKREKRNGFIHNQVYEPILLILREIQDSKAYKAAYTQPVLSQFQQEAWQRAIRLH